MKRGRMVLLVAAVFAIPVGPAGRQCNASSISSPSQSVQAVPGAAGTDQDSKPDPIEALAGTWDVHCMPKGCLMFTDVLVGDPDHPADLKHPEYITIAVAVNRADRKIAYIGFDIPADADRDQGVFVTFAKTTRDGDGWKSSVDKSAMSHLDFDSCDADACVTRVGTGIVCPPDKPKIDLLKEFLTSDHILFLYTRGGVPYRAIKALFPFQRAYRHLMETELKPPA